MDEAVYRGLRQRRHKTRGENLDPGFRLQGAATQQLLKSRANCKGFTGASASGTKGAAAGFR